MDFLLRKHILFSEIVNSFIYSFNKYSLRSSWHCTGTDNTIVEELDVDEIITHNSIITDWDLYDKGNKLGVLRDLTEAEKLGRTL